MRRPHQFICGLAVLASMPGLCSAGDRLAPMLPAEVLERIGLKITEQTLGHAASASSQTGALGTPEISLLEQVAAPSPIYENTWLYAMRFEVEITGPGATRRSVCQVTVVKQPLHFTDPTVLCDRPSIVSGGLEL